MLERSGSADSLQRRSSPSQTLRDAVKAAQNPSASHNNFRSTTENGSVNIPAIDSAHPRPSIRSANAISASKNPGMESGMQAAPLRASSSGLPPVGRGASNLKSAAVRALNGDGDGFVGDLGAAKVSTAPHSPAKKGTGKGKKKFVKTSVVPDVEDYLGPGPGEDDGALGDEPLDEEELRREVMQSIPVPVPRKTVKKKVAAVSAAL